MTSKKIKSAIDSTKEALINLNEALGLAKKCKDPHELAVLEQFRRP